MIHRPAFRSTTRGAFSLLEMILALAILGTSLAVLAQIARTGVDAAREARALATARIICQNKLNELLLNVQAGQAPTTMIDVAADSFDSESSESYLYSVEVMPGQMDGLMTVRLTVKAMAGDGTEQLAIFALDRWYIDPALGLEEAELEEEAAWAERTGEETTT
ncbi:MAG: type II secretion system protein [Planctomycetota bacterium]